MNIFIPAMIAVLLAEFGGRAMLLLRLPRLALAATLLGLSIGGAAFAGASLAPTMNVHARALMLGIAFILTGFSQFGKAKPLRFPERVLGTLRFIWGSGAPFLAFAFSIWSGSPLGAAAGALAGIAGVVALGAAPMAAGSVMWLRRLAGIILTSTGLYAALWALRLIG